jgi:hypothetical protein
MQTTKEKTQKKLHSANPLRLRIHLTPCSLLGGNSNHMTANCAKPQLRNAQLPDNVFSLYACAKFYVCCVFVCARARSRARSCVYLSF